ncbi:hypothetical protein [Lichenibacterium ramalinae]|uniref:Uncharacterized protein n=1 Tax=Lichenibacterium ramalinae TaxID=2316527 RepID=A0A4Q2R4X1_9HYPH|nr:hypothetical protein [Lichenibacterium ramalinae]RYB01372.1 hypothetical protein D3272_26420 [Lichenibacterium ramalinae]
MSKALLTSAERLVRRMEFVPSAPHAGMARYAPFKPFRPDIAEAIARGEYAFQQLTSKRHTYRHRAILMQVQRGTRTRRP